MADLKAEIKIETAKEIVTNAPIADVAEVKHAEWATKRTAIHDGEPYCSNCDVEPRGGFTTDYCPNCGAKTGGGEQP